MVGVFSRITSDVPPYTIGAGVPYKLGGLNLIGLKRHGFPLEVRKALTQAFRLTYRSGLHIKEALEKIAAQDAADDEYYAECEAERRMGA